ncbi:hypothetical protein HN803_08420 [candidate division WWE3 bacterium]|jgi:hypothetical protein|nr:hypothetical protein [candidate division WWE3 bacterium]MBT7350772.1 hypothetical protein [candidate division WWE3 bacterium]
MITATFRHDRIETNGMECADRVWAIYCPELEAWIKTWGKRTVVLTKNPKKIDKNARRNTTQQLADLSSGKAEKWRNMIKEGKFAIA